MLGAILLGILTGLNIALVGMGIILIFKTGKYINFAQAQLGIVPMLVMGKMALEWGVSWYLAFPLALALGALVAVICETLVVRPLSKLGPQAVLVGTLGVAQVLLGLAYVKGLGAPQLDLISHGYPVPFDTSFEIGGATFFAQHILTIIAVPVAAALLWGFLSHTLTGKSIRAAACNEEAARLAGLNIHRLSIIAWAIAGVLATAGAVLAAPNSPGFDPSSVGPGLMFSALGAAALAGFASFPQVAASAVGLSVVEAIVVHQTSDTSKGVLAVFVTILIGLLARRKSPVMREIAGTLGRGASLRPGMTPAFRATRPGRIAAVAFPVTLVVIALIAMAVVSGNDANLYRLDQILIVCAAAAGISLLAGLTGQMSLGQAAFLGLGAAVAAKLVHEGSSSLLVNMLLAAGVTAGVSALVALPSLRGGALMPAVTTLGFGVVASAWLFNQSWLNPDVSDFSGGSSVAPQQVPGLGGVESGTTIFLVLLVLVGLLLAVGTWLQRSSLGIRMTAVRFSEGGARSIGVNVALLRVAAVAVAGAIAGAAGALDVSANQAFTPVSYNPQISLVILSLAVIGGLGSVTGAVVAAAMIFGVPLFLTETIQSLGGNPVQVQLFLGGTFLVINLLLNPGGLASVAAATLERLVRRRSDLTVPVAPPRAPDHAPVARRAPEPGAAVLSTKAVSRSFGAVRALSDVSVTVGRHEIVGLIGNNGAGKTTLLNCVAGDLRHEGDVELFGEGVSSLSAIRRARSGLGRTFQDAGLFAGLTTREVIRLAALQRVDPDEAGSTSRAQRASARERAEEVLDDLGLQPYATTLTADLPTGIKRLVELGIQLARRPGLILLDEPAAGLSQAEAERFGPRLREIVDRLGCSVLMIEHDLPLMLSIADRIYCLELGEVIAEGTPDEIRQDSAVIESYFGSPGGVGARRSGGLEPVVGV